MTQFKEEPGFLSRLLSRNAPPEATPPAPPEDAEPEGSRFLTRVADFFSFNSRTDTPAAVLTEASVSSSSEVSSARSPSKRVHGKSRHRSKQKPAAIAEHPLASVIDYLENGLWALYHNETTVCSSTIPVMPERIKNMLARVTEWWERARNDDTVERNETVFLSKCFSFATGNQLVTDLLAPTPDSRKPPLYHALRDSIKELFPNAPNDWNSGSMIDAETAKAALRRHLQALVYYADYLDTLTCRQAILTPFTNLSTHSRSLLEALVTTYPRLNTDKDVFAHWKPFLTNLQEAIETLPQSQQEPLTALYDAISDHLDNGPVSQLIPGRMLSHEQIEPLTAAISKCVPKDHELTGEALSKACAAAETLGQHMAKFTQALQERAALDAAEAAAKKALDEAEALFATERQTVKALLEKNRALLSELNKAIVKLYGLPTDHPGQGILDMVNTAFRDKERAEAFRDAAFTPQATSSSSSSSSSPQNEPPGDRHAWLEQVLSNNRHITPRLEALISAANEYIQQLTEIFKTESETVLRRAAALEEELGALLGNTEGTQSLKDEASRLRPISTDPVHLNELRSDVDRYCTCLTSLFEKKHWARVSARLRANYTKRINDLDASIIEPVVSHGHRDNPYTETITRGNASLKTRMAALRERLSELTFESRKEWNQEIRNGLANAERLLVELRLTREKRLAWERVQEKIVVLEDCLHHLSFTGQKRNHYHPRNFYHTSDLSQLSTDLASLIGRFKGLQEALQSVSALLPAIAGQSHPAIMNMRTWERMAEDKGLQSDFERCTATANQLIARFEEHDKRLRNPSLGVAEGILTTIAAYKNGLVDNDPRRRYLDEVSSAITLVNNQFLNPETLLENRGVHQRPNPADAYRQQLSNIVTVRLQNDLERFSDGENSAFYQWVRRYIFYPLQCIGNLCSSNRFFVTWGATSLEQNMARLGNTNLNPETPLNRRPNPIRDEDDGFSASDDENAGRGYRFSNTPGTM